MTEELAIGGAPAVVPEGPSSAPPGQSCAQWAKTASAPAVWPLVCWTGSVRSGLSGNVVHMTIRGGWQADRVAGRHYE